MRKFYGQVSPLYILWPSFSLTYIYGLVSSLLIFMEKFLTIFQLLIYLYYERTLSSIYKGFDTFMSKFLLSFPFTYNLHLRASVPVYPYLWASVPRLPILLAKCPPFTYINGEVSPVYLY